MNQVPSNWPTLETLRAVDSQSIFLKWRALPQKYINGILRGYKIQCLSRYPWQSFSVSADQLQVTITGLQSCAFHHVEISAFTSKGEGPRRHVHVTTCMYFNILILYQFARESVFWAKLKIPLHARCSKILIFINPTQIKNGSRTCTVTKHIAL